MQVEGRCDPISEANVRFMCIAVMAAVALSGCAEMGWYKQGATTTDLHRDTYTCEKDVRQSGYYGGGGGADRNMRDFYTRCMRAAGWTRMSREDYEATKQRSLPGPSANVQRPVSYHPTPYSDRSSVLPEAAFNFPKLSDGYRRP